MSRYVQTRRAAVIGAILSTGAIGVTAGNENVTNLESALARCAKTAPSGARLACYDALAAQRFRIAIPPSSSASAPPLSPSPTAQDFGLNAAQKQKARPQKQIQSIEASVIGIRTSAIGRMLVELSNGQLWELDSADPLLAMGNLVTIRRGALGSYLLTTPSRRTHYARRMH